MKSFLTRYHPRYVRSLLYMLQQAEYSPSAFAEWYFRTRDFLNVERRKALVWTLKIKIFAAAMWGLIAITAYVMIEFILLGGIFYALAALTLFALPFALAAALSGFAFLFSGVQWLAERFYLARAAKKLAAMKAFKIAVAGSYGKTTMREILKTVLAEKMRVAAPPASYNTPIAISRFIDSLSGDEEVLVFELGEYYPGDVLTLCEVIQPDLGVITGVNEAHLEKFGELDETANTIFELAESLKRKPLYVNAESELAREYAPKHAVLYSREGAGELMVSGASTGLTGLSFMLEDGNMAVAAHSKLLGFHMIGPLAAAAHIAMRLGLPSAAVEAGLSKTKAFAHRMQPREEEGITIIDDSYNGNPDGARAAVEFLSNLKGRRWYVTPGFVEMGPRSKIVHEELGRELARAGIEKVALIKTNVAKHIRTGLQKENFKGEIIEFPSMPGALSSLKNMTVEGDIMLIQNDWPDQYV